MVWMSLIGIVIVAGVPHVLWIIILFSHTDYTDQKNAHAAMSLHF